MVFGINMVLDFHSLEKRPLLILENPSGKMILLNVILLKMLFQLYLLHRLEQLDLEDDLYKLIIYLPQL